MPSRVKDGIVAKALGTSADLDFRENDRLTATIDLGPKCYSAGCEASHRLVSVARRATVTQPSRLWLLQSPWCRAVRPFVQLKEAL